MTINPLQQLLECGQSVWLDELRRDWLQTGELREFIRRDGVRGLTSNPSIFQKAIGGSKQYDDQLAALARQGLAADDIYDTLTIDDIRGACDQLRSVYESSDGEDGFVSHEVSPRLAYDGAGTTREARRLWERVDRPNLMIKIPATREGLPAIRESLEAGINVNVTLMFSLEQYDAVAGVHLGALEARRALGLPLDHVASVASFFVSRVDSLVDKRLLALQGGTAGSAVEGHVGNLFGKAAVANAKRAYRRYQEMYEGTRFARLAAHGARPQRVLWASTSTKNPAYSDVLYVDQLIGPRTVNTLPLDTLVAFRDHGRVAPTLTQGLDEADDAVRRLAELGIDLDVIGRELLDDGVDKFVAALDGVLVTVEERRRGILGG